MAHNSGRVSATKKILRELMNLKKQVKKNNHMINQMNHQVNKNNNMVNHINKKVNHMM